ncbi:unnamed protein product [Sympodiomycopsis kandeliae]
MASDIEADVANIASGSASGSGSTSSRSSSSSTAITSASPPTKRSPSSPALTYSKKRQKRYDHQDDGVSMAFSDDIDPESRAAIQAMLDLDRRQARPVRSSRVSASRGTDEDPTPQAGPSNGDKPRGGRKPRAAQSPHEIADEEDTKVRKHTRRRKSASTSSSNQSRPEAESATVTKAKGRRTKEKPASNADAPADEIDTPEPPSKSNKSRGKQKAQEHAVPIDIEAQLLAAIGEQAQSSSSTGRPQRSASARKRDFLYQDAFLDDGAVKEDDDPSVKSASAAERKRSRPSSTRHRPEDIIRFTQNGQLYEYQYGRCSNPRWNQWPRCCSCVAKITGDLCRFIGIRVFPLDATKSKISPKPFDPTPATTPDQAPFLASERYVNVKFDYPPAKALFPPSNDDSISSIKSIAAKSLLPTMETELAHAIKSTTLWRKPELDIRPQCEFCLTSLFSSSYLCRGCGREYCVDCFKEMETNGINAEEATGAKFSRYTCRFKTVHSAMDMVPMTRLRLDEVQNEVEEMKRILKDHEDAQSSSHESETSACSWKSPEEIERLKKSKGPETDRQVGSHTLTEFPHDVDEQTFRKAWAQGDPLVVHDCITELRHDNKDATQAAWGPWSFTSGGYQSEQCWITRCDQDATNAVVTVSDFFSTFGQDADTKKSILGNGIWKLKDWPPSSAFDDTFPDLYRHFNISLPMPDYTRRDGRMNISAHFPKNANVPDLGPKMYNAWPSREDQVAKGSTRLHMDIADAVNIMYYAAPCATTQEEEESEDDEYSEEKKKRSGSAAWDIFPARDSHKIRDYLRRTRKGVPTWEDPIHSQKYFLDNDDRRSLWTSYGVRSWRIYQRPGDSVFIPAGCAHQVCNLTDCMKIAVDFVSPENVTRCFNLTSEFRLMSNNLVKSWKEDVLQLKSMLWHSWRACRAMEGYKYTSQPRKNDVPDRMDRPIDLKNLFLSSSRGKPSLKRNASGNDKSAQRSSVRRSSTSRRRKKEADVEESIAIDRSDRDDADDDNSRSRPATTSRRKRKAAAKENITITSSDDDDDDGNHSRPVNMSASRMSRPRRSSSQRVSYKLAIFTSDEEEDATKKRGGAKKAVDDQESEAVDDTVLVDDDKDSLFDASVNDDVSVKDDASDDQEDQETAQAQDMEQPQDKPDAYEGEDRDAERPDEDAEQNQEQEKDQSMDEAQGSDDEEEAEPLSQSTIFSQRTSSQADIQSQDNGPTAQPQKRSDEHEVQDRDQCMHEDQESDDEEEAEPLSETTIFSQRPSSQSDFYERDAEQDDEDDGQSDNEATMAKDHTAVAMTASSSPVMTRSRSGSATSSSSSEIEYNPSTNNASHTSSYDAPPILSLKQLTNMTDPRAQEAYLDDLEKATAFQAASNPALKGPIPYTTQVKSIFDRVNEARRQEEQNRKEEGIDQGAQGDQQSSGIVVDPIA